MGYYAIPPIVKYKCLAIAKSMTPYDTGNLRHNAVRLTSVKASSFSILYDSSRAYYLDYVNQKQHYVEDTVGKIGMSLQGFFDEGIKGFHDGASKFNSIAKQAQTEALSTAQSNPERQWRLTESILKSKGSNYKWR